MPGEHQIIRQNTTLTIKAGNVFFPQQLLDLTWALAMWVFEGWCFECWSS